MDPPTPTLPICHNCNDWLVTSAYFVVFRLQTLFRQLKMYPWQIHTWTQAMSWRLTLALLHFIKLDAVRTLREEREGRTRELAALSGDERLCSKPIKGRGTATATRILTCLVEVLCALEVQFAGRLAIRAFDNLCGMPWLAGVQRCD